MTVSTTELPHVLGLSRERVRILARTGEIQCEPDGRWDPEKVKRALAENLKPLGPKKKGQEEASVAGRTTQTYETWRLTKEKADLAELERKQLEGSLLPADKVNTWNGGMIIRAAEILDRIPGELADRLAQQADPSACSALLKRELDRARFELAAYRNA